MTLPREDFIRLCLACNGNGKIPISDFDSLDQREIIIIRKCADCKGSGEVLTQEGEAIFNLLLFKRD